jgi:transcriptional regulator with XRE-family HTH domain
MTQTPGRSSLTASAEVREKARIALLGLGYTQQALADFLELSRSTVSKFFNGSPITVDRYKQICDALGLNWEDCLPREQPIAKSQTASCCIAVTDQEEKTMQILHRQSRQIIVIDRQNKIQKAEIVLTGDVDSVENLKILEEILRQHSGDTIVIFDVKPGSIKLFIEGSDADIEKLINLVQSKTLTKLNTFPIESIRILDADEPSNNQRNNIISLSGKFNKRNFPDGWDDPKKFINQTIEGSRPLSSQVRSQENERNEIGKIIHLTQINTSLLLIIKKEELNETVEKGLHSITLQILTTNQQIQLPENLKILVFYESSGEIIDEKLARRKTLRSSFIIESKSPFCIEVKLGEKTIEKGLYVL